jgi:hypothetical protein
MAVAAAAFAGLAGCVPLGSNPAPRPCAVPAMVTAGGVMKVSEPGEWDDAENVVVPEVDGNTRQDSWPDCMEEEVSP